MRLVIHCVFLGLPQLRDNGELRQAKYPATIQTNVSCRYDIHCTLYNKMRIKNPSKFAANEGCLQWYTGSSGTVQTFNFDGGIHLANQDQLICVR